MPPGSNPTNGQPTSTTCNSSTVTGLGVETAMKIFYNAMLVKTSSSSYLKYRTWTLTAAKNLFPGSCAEFNTAKAAWDAVSVPAQSADPTCSATGTVTVASPGNQSTAVGLPLSASGGTTTLATYSNLNNASGYLLKTIDLSSFAGTTVALKFTSVEDSSLKASFVIDNGAVTLS